MQLCYSPIAQTWLLLFGRNVETASVVERYETREQAVVDLRYRRLTVERNGNVVPAA